MDASDLRIFKTVARLGSMSRAGAHLNTVQSNVTARIRALEEEIGAPLFDRHSRGVSLTAVGRRLLPYAESVAHMLDDALRATSDRGTPSGPLVVGSLETTAALRLSPLLSTYVSLYPKVDLVLRTGTTRELIDAVLNRRLEGAFVCGPANHPELCEEAAFQEELVILTAPKIASLDEVFENTNVKIIVLRAGCSYREMLEKQLARRGIVNVRQLEFGTLESIFNCVSAGLGITLLPRSLIGTVWNEHKVAIHPIDRADSLVATTFVRRHDGYVSSAMQAFLELARKNFSVLQIAAE